MIQTDSVIQTIGRLGRNIRGVTGNAETASPLELLPHRARWFPLGAFVAVICVGLIRLNPNPPLAVAAALVAIGAGVLLNRERRPALLLGYTLVATVGIAVLGNGMSSNVGWFAVCLLGGWCMVVGRPRDGLLYLGGVILLFAVEWLWIAPDPGWGAWMGGTTLSVLACLLLRHEIALVGQLRAAQAGLADRAKAQERNRIARELHDVIAHTLTVSLLHVTSARLAVEFDPDDAARSLAEAERLGRESLAEVRSAVGLLRQEGDSAGIAPLPDVTGVPALIERFQAARTDITLGITGDTDGLPATTGLAVYRILQEALTNAVKHAPGLPIVVELNIDATAVYLTVDSAGKPRQDSGTGAGIGVVSMRERAEALGGDCAAGPGGRGWLVRARLPREPRRRAT